MARVEPDKVLARTEVRASDGMHKLKKVEARSANDEELKLTDTLTYFTRDTQAAKGAEIETETGSIREKQKWIEQKEEKEKNLEGLLVTDGPAESSAGYGSRTSPTSLTKLENILDDNGEGTKRVEEMLGPARPVKTGHLSI
ncbi:hypothetical protein RB195_015450 [Necator americanus]|uniref:Uncharacterized protein n=1 Tax=Necator americanus TaxID=51031 RepID=A0ABR1E530_NECAM